VNPGFTDNVVAVELTRSRRMRTCATSKRSAKRSAPMVLPSQLISVTVTFALWT
jgi:hypothetical protein